MRSVLADAPSTKTGRPLLRAVGPRSALALSVALVAAMLIALVLQDERRRADPPGLTTGGPSPAAASTALRRFVEAVDERDPGLARDAAPPGNVDAAELLAALVGNAEKLAVSDFSARYVDAVGAVSPDGSWAAAVELTWRFAGFDGVPARAEVLVHLGGAGADTGIVQFGGDQPARGRRTPVWLTGPIQVAGNDKRVVLVAGSAVQARRVARRVDVGIHVVRRMLPRWRPRVVVEVPASAAALDEALGTEPGTHGSIAAVTAAVGAPAGTRTPAHVFVNPDVSDDLRPAGAQVVMSHELTHLATDATASPMQVWLLEGFADYVALRDVALPDRTTLARAIRLARRSGVPDHLPGPAELDSRAGDLQAAYEQAWLACRIVAERLGERGLVRVYRAADRGVPVERALRQAGLRQGELLREWRRRLRDLAG
ncbi:hypothetical protein EXE58_00435 [Nocardioides seonyuensis]|uniref:Peptidase MA-like domain-containing protein n=1 Tax=Nocardioides seonyuensis TaxID=2518371 RepID=A0A4P7IC05_9ACTN|nr:hypothetical protein [Nocardioides seonyuensis]QBX54090.1 hypothetical protein EXE58_00435 [Nocardioides seonyuensis]